MSAPKRTIDIFQDVFKPYPHQKEFIKAFFSGQYKFFMENIHRRGGKDAELFTTAWLCAATTPGNYVYTLPKINQARNVVWEGRDLEGRFWIDAIPDALIKKRNNTLMKLYFQSGSVLHITGADNLLNTHLGSNLRGIIISEFQKTSPLIWDYIRPILKRSKGFACFAYTSLGQGHAYRLFERNKNKEDWLCRKLTVDDTRDESGDYIFSPEQIQEERESGMDEDLIKQEYYCDDTVAVKEAFFAEHIIKAEQEGRITKLDVLPKSPVHTSWDLGSRDTNSIWFFQVVQHKDGPRFRYFYQHDRNYGDIDYYLQLLTDIQKRYGFYNYGHHFVPHDITTTEYISGKSRRVMMMEKGLNVTMVPRMRVIERVQVARSAFHQCWFDESGCQHGLDALRVARANYDSNKKVFISDEVHDWSSHPSAAFQYGHVGWMASYNKDKIDQQRSYARRRR